jgi:hypothetical protein
MVAIEAGCAGLDFSSRAVERPAALARGCGCDAAGLIADDEAEVDADVEAEVEVSVDWDASLSDRD